MPPIGYVPPPNGYVKPPIGYVPPPISYIWSHLHVIFQIVKPRGTLEQWNLNLACGQLQPVDNLSSIWKLRAIEALRFPVLRTDNERPSRALPSRAISATGG
jgi:hypothetical protein